MLKLDKIIFTVCMKHNIKLKPTNQTEIDRMERVKKMNINDTPFVNSFHAYITKHENFTETFWATNMWKSRFCKSYNLKYNKTYKTFYSKLYPVKRGGCNYYYSSTVTKCGFC